MKSKGLPFLLTFTGCDVVSAFRGKCKRAASETWDVYPEASEVLAKLSNQYVPTSNWGRRKEGS